jgi:hypothetical protein
MKNRTSVGLLALLSCSCVLPPTQAEQMTYQAVAPAHAAYVIADPALDPMARQRRLDLLEAWRIRVGVAKEPAVQPAPNPLEVPQ